MPKARKDEASAQKLAKRSWTEDGHFPESYLESQTKTKLTEDKLRNTSLRTSP